MFPCDSFLNRDSSQVGVDGPVGAASLETSLCAAYPKESRSHEVKTIAIVLSVITFPVVALRCISRWMITRRLWWDDWTAVFATVSLISRERADRDGNRETATERGTEEQKKGQRDSKRGKEREKVMTDGT